MRNFSRAAFTVVELLLVLGIGIILGTGVVFLSPVHRAERALEAQAGAIAATLRNAQQRAIAQELGESWGVHFDYPASGTGFYQVYRGATYAGGVKDARHNLSSGLRFNSPMQGNATDVLFAKNTGLPGGAASIVIEITQKASMQKTISISAEGVVSR